MITFIISYILNYVVLDILIINGTLVIPEIGLIKKNIGIKDGTIKVITSDMLEANRVINAEDKYIIPGAIDPHVHYGVFEPIERSALHESKAAAIGGITCMMRMLRLYGSYKELLNLHLEASKVHIVDYAYHASILLPQQIEEIEYCIKQGIRSFKLYMNLRGEIGSIYMDMLPYNDKLIEGRVEIDEYIINNTLNHAAKNDAIVIVHAEDPYICIDGIKRLKSMNRNDLAAWSEARPPISEVKAIDYITNLSKTRNCKLYLAHIGSKEGLEEALKHHDSIYIETCPHYLTHTVDFDIRGKVVPPLRSKEDQMALWNAIMNCKIDCIGSDHVANKLKDKLKDNTIWNALSGFPGIATLLPVMLSEGVNKGRISLEKLTKLTSYNAARIFGLSRKGNITIGYDADLVILDIKKEMKVRSDILYSYSDYTIYDGMILKGWPILTMVRGEIVMEDHVVVGKSGHGKYIKRYKGFNVYE